MHNNVRSARTKPLALIGLAVLLAAGAAPPASADSLVFVKDHDVWLANPDGTGLYRVTTDGTADNPYQSPSQTDDGRIVTMRAKPNGAPLMVLRQNGEQIGQVPVGAVQAGPMDPQVSPDGQHVAFGIVRAAYVNHYLETTTDVRTVRVGDGLALGETGSRANTPSWLDASTVLTGAGPVAKLDPVGELSSEWWSDYDHWSTFGKGEDLRDGEYAAGRAAFVRGEGLGKSMQLYKAAQGPATKPTPTCVFTDPAAGPLGAKYVDPTFSPDGKRLAWQEGNGVWTVSQPSIDDCNIEPKLTIPGASEPDWSPANVNPAPRPVPTPTPGAGPNPGASPAGGGLQPGAAAISYRATITSATRSRVTVKVTGAPAGKVQAALTVKGRTIARGSAKASARGTATIKLAVPAAARRGLKAKAKGSLTLTATGGAKQTLSVTLR